MFATEYIQWRTVVFSRLKISHDKATDADGAMRKQS